VVPEAQGRRAHPRQGGQESIERAPGELAVEGQVLPEQVLGQQELGERAVLQFPGLAG
jgi:hypothetical protein